MPPIFSFPNNRNFVVVGGSCLPAVIEFSPLLD